MSYVQCHECLGFPANPSILTPKSCRADVLFLSNGCHCLGENVSRLLNLQDVFVGGHKDIVRSFGLDQSVIHERAECR